MLIGLIAVALAVASVLSIFTKLDTALIVLFTNVITGSFTLLRGPTSKNVTIDNAATDPVPVDPK